MIKYYFYVTLVIDILHIVVWYRLTQSDVTTSLQHLPTMMF